MKAKLIFYSFLILHVFLGTQKTDYMYIFGLVIYLVMLYSNNLNHSRAFLDGLIFIAFLPILVLLKADKAALILADYVFLMFLTGLFIQYISLLFSDRKKNQILKDQYK